MWTSEEVQLERKKAYAEGRADAIKEFPTHLPAIDEESRKKLNATINEAAEFIRQEAYDKGQAEGHQKGWGAGYDGAMNNAVLALAREAGDGYGPELEKSIKARDHRIHQAALVEVDRAWSWWWVLAPFWMPLALVLACVAIGALVVGVLHLIDRRPRRRF